MQMMGNIHRGSEGGVAPFAATDAVRIAPTDSGGDAGSVVKFMCLANRCWHPLKRLNNLQRNPTDKDGERITRVIRLAVFQLATDAFR